MATAPRARAAQPPVEDDFYAEEVTQGQPQGGDTGRDGGQGDRSPAARRGQGSGPNEDRTPLDAGTEQTPGGPEDLDPEDPDYVDPAGDEEDDFFFTPPSRGEHRQQTLANENRELKRQLEEMRRPVQPAAPAAPAGQQFETDEQFEARIQLLGFEDKMEARYRRDRQLRTLETTQTRIESANQNDRARFEAKAMTDKRFARWQPRVEAEFTRRQQMGQLVSRFDILKWMIGDRIVDGDAEPVQRERQRAAGRVARATVRPARTGSDVQAGRRGQLSEREARARRLENVQI